ncbi:hypothetical protein [Rickettsia hoogstraalii]|nr:hypothetical protein [Rickettsia hoogstraalii]
MQGKIENFDEAISGVLFYEIATLLSVARNDGKTDTYNYSTP